MAPPINRRADVSVPHTYTQIHIYFSPHTTPNRSLSFACHSLACFISLLFTLDMERPPVGRWFASACVCICVCVCASLSLWPSACPCGVGGGALSPSLPHPPSPPPIYKTTLNHRRHHRCGAVQCECSKKIEKETRNK